MSFSNTSGTCIIPTLSRLILCAAFIPAGYNKVFTKVELSEAAAQRLIDLEVDLEAIDASEQASIGVGRSVVLVSLQDDAEATDPVDPASQEAQDPQPPEDDPTPPPVIVDPEPASGDDSQAATYKAQGLYMVAAMLPESWPAPVAMAWLAALTELVCGCLLLVGLASRLAGLGLACTMAVAFYLTSLPAWLDLGLFTGLFNLSMPVFTGMFTQLGLFALAFGVLLTGPGPISLDRALFRKSDDGDDDDEDDDL